MKNAGMVIAVSILAVLVLILGGMVLSYSSQIKTLKEQQQELTSSYETLNTNYNALSASYSSLKEQSALSVSSKEEVIASPSPAPSATVSPQGPSQMSQDIDRAIDRFDEFETIVKQSRTWFQSNNNLASLDGYDSLKADLMSECVNNEDDLSYDPDYCSIDFNCINRMSRARYGLHYKTDDNTVMKSDFLKDLNTIYQQKGGDCEDFALVFTAEYNYLFDQCLSKGFERSKVRAVSKPEGRGTYYAFGAYMYPVCGTFDPGEVTGYWAGHCVVALTDSPILSASDIYPQLRDAVLVEPQTGEYFLTMGDKKEKIKIQVFDESMEPDTYFYIDFVITSDDLKIFNPWSEKTEWLGYAEFQKEAELIKQQILEK